jgi:hypothetical protein
LLWELTLVFAGITLFYVVLIFILRYRISGKRHQIEIQKRELAPMVSHFLFFPQGNEAEAAEAEDLRRRQEFRKLAEHPLNREVLSEILHELSQDVSGTARQRLLSLYQQLGLQEDAYKKLRSRKWETISKGILELTDMQVEQAYFVIRKFIHHKRSILRKQAELAIISLTDAGIQSFLDAASNPISEWQQLRIMEILKRKESFHAPDFRHWLASENEDVVLLSLRLIRFYKQSEAADKITGLLSHRSIDLQQAALECLRDFAYAPAKETLKENFSRALPQIKLGILDALQPLLESSDIDWLKTRASEDTAFVVRNKASATLHALEALVTPDSVNPETALESNVPGQAETSTVIDKNSGTKTAADTSAEERAFNLLLDVLKPDFSNLGEGEDFLEEDSMVPTPDNLTEERWKMEDALVFDACLLEELEDICSITPESAEVYPQIPGFVPFVDQPLNPTHMNPHEPSPEWLLRIEVQAEILLSDSGHARVLREILLENLEETQHVLSTNFVPWVTEPSTTSGSEEEQRKETETLLNQFPEFEVIAEDIQDLSTHETSITMHDLHPEPDAEKGLPDYFSIFHEFFRTYDTESKLILMDEIPEIGGEKELRFLSELFEDPNPRVRAKARKTHKVLMKRLGLTAEDLKGPLGSLWTPKSGNDTPQDNPSGVPEEARAEHQEKEEMEEVGFEPEFEGSEPPSAQKTVPRKKASQNGYLKLLKYLNGNQEEDNAK